MTSETCANCGFVKEAHERRDSFKKQDIDLLFADKHQPCEKFKHQNHSPQKQEGCADVKAKDKSLLSSSGGKQK